MHHISRKRKTEHMIKRKYKTTDELTDIIEQELDNLFRYAFYRLGDIQDAEDIIQDLYLTIHAKRGEAEKISNPKSYIYRALSNNCTLSLRRRTQSKTISLESCDDIEVLDTYEIEPQSLEEEFTLINRLLNSIPQEQSEVIRLHIHGKRSFVEIAEILDIPTTTAKSRFKYGIDKLKTKFIKENN